jgi:UDP-GlcNAc:undecaprenyl-phosphate GlcNAc-1-phosphate transferase
MAATLSRRGQPRGLAGFVIATGKCVGHPRGVTFPRDVYLLAFFGAVISSLATLPLWRRWCVRTGLVDDPGHRKIHESPIALAGGLAVRSGMLLPLAGAWVVLHFNFLPSSVVDALDYGFGRRAGQLTAVLAGAVGIVVLGWLDDKHELKAGPKFIGQLVIAGLVAAAGVRITLFVPNPVFSYAVTILWIVAVINAFNFMDNMNGLCAGLGAVGAACFAFSAGEQGQYLVTLLALLICGALIGFLPYNYPKASAFLGDAGSHLVGFLLAVIAILPHFHTARRPDKLAVLTPLLILSVALGDMAWVVVLRWRLGKPFYLGDNNHLSHRLTRRGLGKPQAVALIWAAAAATGALSFLL